MSRADFLLHNPSFDEAQNFDALCKPLAQFGITYFSHAHIDKQQRLFVLAQAPHHLRHYVENNYYHFDAHQLKPEDKEHYLLWDLVKRHGPSEQLHGDFMAHGFGHTFTLMRQNTEGFDCYNFATHRGNDSINNVYLQQLDNLKAFIAYFHSTVNQHKSLKKAYHYPLPCAEGQYLSSREATANSEILTIKKIPIPGSMNHLSAREYQCLEWIAFGKTQEQIGEILSITPRTVKAHFANLRRKLNCYNQFQLGMKYAELKHLFGTIMV